MSALDSSKPFDELTDAELAELEAHDWTSEQIQGAIALALKSGDMESAASLLLRLAKKDPTTAGLIVAMIEARR